MLEEFTLMWIPWTCLRCKMYQTTETTRFTIINIILIRIFQFIVNNRKI